MKTAQESSPLQATIRPVRPPDNAMLAALIRTVLPEFGGTGEGCAIMDPEVDHMYETYSAVGSAYFILEQGGEIVGGAGIAPLAGGGSDICELQKTYLCSGARGRGYGRMLIERCLESARMCGYRRCYLETFSTMHEAQKLYEKSGFARLNSPLGNTGHYQCTHWYIKEL